MRYRIGLLVSLIFLLAHNTFAACNADGFTVVYINGVKAESEKAVQKDMGALRDNFTFHSSMKNVTFITGYNPSHLAGLGDIAETISQMQDSAISNYDRDTILLQIHPEITTQKVLLVGHSQGTLYTNEVYDYLIRNGEPKDAIGVYNIATPASFVAGGGRHLTSANDKVINLARENAGRIGADPHSG
jgi:hypothetical protein